MIRLAITQRVDEVAHYRERRDALDQRWVARLQGWALPRPLWPVPVPNGLQDAGAWAHELGITAVLLTGGGDIGRAPERDRCEWQLLDAARLARWPVLGVCRGFQVLNSFLGGRLQAVSGHVGVRHRVHRSAEAWPWAVPVSLPSSVPETAEVNSFHAQGIAAGGLAPGLRPLLVDDQGGVEAAAHVDLPWAGMLWHPEREPEGFTALDQAFLSILASTP